MVTPPKNNFLPLFWKMFFFRKKLLNEKYLKHAHEKGYIDFCCQTPPPSKQSCPPTNEFFAVFSENTDFFSKNLFYNKTFVT